MQKAAIIPFFSYEPVNSGYNLILPKFFQLHLRKWIKYVDKVYFIDSGCNISENDLLSELRGGKIEILRKPSQSHWQNMNEAIRHADEPLLLLLDSDTVIYDPDIVRIHFEAMDEFKDKIWSIFDSSGGDYLGDKYPCMAENSLRAERRRLCPYLCFIHKAVLRSGFDFTPVGGEHWTDSMGVITQQLLEDGIQLQELQDDRSSIYLEDNGNITSCQWLDTAPKEWAIYEQPDLGYYHIRNFGGGFELLRNGSFGLVPGREARRLLMWEMVVAEKVGIEIPDIFELKKTEYYKRFLKYHSWLFGL